MIAATLRQIFEFSFELKTARQNHENQITTMSSDLEDSQGRCKDLEFKITALCEEIEKLQVRISIYEPTLFLVLVLKER